MNIIIYLLIFSILFYGGMIIWFIIGNLYQITILKSTNSPPISIIIAIRNGEKSLPYLLKDLLAQDYNGEMEFILVDDESIDNTKLLIYDLASKDQRFKYVSSNEGMSILNHKKRALDAGISMAKNEWLLFTDVDCRIKSGWVRTIAQYCTNQNDYIIGYSEVNRGSNWSTTFQSIDFFMLMISARGSVRNGSPWACSGQNQAYRKSMYIKVGGFTQIADKLQGDDTLFLQICRSMGTTNVVFIDQNACRITARQEKSWKALLKQRIRWSGDAKVMLVYNKIFFLGALFTFLLPILLLLCFILGTFYKSYYIIVFIIFFILKIILELFLYLIGIHRLSKSIYYFDFCFWSIIHIPYVISMGIGSLFINRLSWRGR